MREKNTIDRMKREKEAKKDNSDTVFYVSSSYLIDGIYPMAVGLYKSRLIRRLRTDHMTLLPSTQRHRWTAQDADKSVVGTIFTPVTMSSIYEDRLQRLLLHPAFRLRETHKLNPRGALLASVAMYASDHDPIVDVHMFKTTTLRGIMMNALDGSLYAGMTFSSLKSPFEVSSEVVDEDSQKFCNDILRCSFQAVCLTMIGVKCWRSDRLPENRFAENNEGFITIKSQAKEVIYDHTDDVWMLKYNKKLCYVQDFKSLLGYIYDPMSAPAAIEVDSPS